MNKPLSFRAALALAGAFAAGPAFADAQATFYSWANFGGQDLTIAEASREFNVGGAAPESALIRSGQWEICTRPDFLGRCTVIGPGEYPAIGQQFGHIASAREVGATPPMEREYRRRTVTTERRTWGWWR